MKIKNYEWNGFGFPLIFEELPAVKLRGELVPDVDFNAFAKPVIQFICANQEIPLSGNQVKFIRMHLGMTLRQFAEFVGVRHQSVMRWEEKGKSAANVDAHIEFVLRLKVLKKLDSKAENIKTMIERVEQVETFKKSTYRSMVPQRIPERVVHAHP